MLLWCCPVQCVTVRCCKVVRARYGELRSCQVRRGIVWYGFYGEAL
jgi:hypothetical protein